MKNYKFGRKNNWRRWLWNRIDERLAVPSKDATVIYLAGSQDLDRREALRHGFRESNLICIDRDTAVISALRENGRLAINATFYDALINWSPHRRIDVALGDFCGDWGAKDARQLGRLWIHKCLSNATIAFNFCRGRNNSSNAVRMRLQGLLTGLFDNADEQMKHRGILFGLQTLTNVLDGMNPGADWTTLARDDEDRVFRFLQRGLNTMAFNSYRSESQIFDSVVYRMDWDAQIRLGGAEGEYISRVYESVRSVRKHSQFLDVTVQRKISATLAHRTRRAA